VQYAEIKAIGFTSKELKAEGFGARELRLCGFLAMELIHIGLTLHELTEGGFEPSVVAAVSGCSAIFLKGEGFDAATLWKAGFPVRELKAALFDAPLLRSVGCSAEHMRLGGFGLRELIRDAGYSGRQLRTAGFTASDFLASPCSITELRAAGFTPQECIDSGLDTEVVEVIYEKRKPPTVRGPVPPELVEIGKLREAGMTCEQARNGGLLPSQCHDAGFSFEEGRAAGFKRKIADWLSMELTNPYNKWER